MLDNIVGRPSFSWRRKETYAVLLLSLYCILSSSKRGPRVLWIRPLNRALQRFSPWQIIAATLTLIHALRHVDKIFGLDAPDHPPGYLYSSEYNRATWIVTGLDAGFATAMSIRPKWLRDIASMVFSIYYFWHGDEADSKIHKFREVCTLDMLRVTWDKMNNPYLRAISAPFRPRLPIRRQLSLSRPEHSSYTRPITAWLFFAGSDEELRQATELILDFPGGGFVAMGPTHHEERLRSWAKRMKRPVLSVDYGKAPEFPYPYAIDEGFDAYCSIIESAGRILGLSGKKLNIIFSGDSAGGNIAVNVMLKILESSSPSSPHYPLSLPHPAGIALTYAALNFSFTSWAWPSGPTPSPSSASLNSTNSPGALPNHSNISAATLSTSSTLPPFVSPHIGPMSDAVARRGIGFVESKVEAKGRERHVGEENEWKWTTRRSIVHQQTNLSLFERQQEVLKALETRAAAGAPSPSRSRSRTVMQPQAPEDGPRDEERRSRSNSVSDGQAFQKLQEKLKDKELDLSLGKRQLAQMEPRLTMSSKTGYLHDRIITPSMMWAMCLLYLGPRFRPGVEHDYHLSPILAPAELLAMFPPMLLQCGGRDPLVDDTVLFGGRVKEAKRKGGLDEIEDIEEMVKMQIFPGWSHGYLQMSAIMPEARVAIDDIADWIGATFERTRSSTGDLPFS